MNPQLSHALTLALLHFLWQGALIGALGSIVLRLTAGSSAQLRYAIACIGLFAMPVAVIATVQYEFRSSQTTILPSNPERIDSPFTASSASTSPSVTALPSTPVHAEPSLRESWRGIRRSLQVWILPLWLCGVALFCIYRLLCWIAAIRLRRQGVCAVSAVWQQKLVTLTGRLRFSRAIALLESSLIDTPLTMGAVRPVILLPVGLLAGLPVEQIELILLHELAHIRRHDYLVNLLQSLIENLLFYHPAVWWLSKQVRAEREFCCDDIVVAITANGPAYARALTNLERQRGLAYSAAVAATGGNLMIRVRRILGQPIATRNASTPILGLLLVAAATAGAWQSPTSSTPRTVSTSVLKSNPTVEELIAQAQAPLKSRSSQPVLVAQAVPVAQPAPNSQREAAEPATNVSDTIQRRIRAQEETRRRLEQALLRQTLEIPYKKWLNEEVRWIVTEEERTAFQLLQTDEERQRFIEQFWLRRDPTPDTPENEFKEEHYRRVAWANDRFGTAQLPGWKSDRGMIYVKYGPPDSKEEHPTPGLRAEPTFVPYERWHYLFLDGVGKDITLEFVDAPRTGEYRLVWEPSSPGASPTLYEKMGLAAELDRATANPAVQRAASQARLLALIKQTTSVAYQRWFDEEAVYILSPEERAAFQRITDDERQKFIEQFWLRRDPTPGTPGNEARDEHYRRIAYANEHFANNDLEGWRTDRGAIYIVFGPPDQEIAMGGQASTGGPLPALGRIVEWNYGSLEGVGQGISIKFVNVGDPNANKALFLSGNIAKPAANTTAYRTFAQLQARQ